MVQREPPSILVGLDNASTTASEYLRPYRRLKNIAKTSEIVVDFAKAKLVDPTNQEGDSNLSAAEEAALDAVRELMKLPGGCPQECIRGVEAFGSKSAVAPSATADN